MYRMLAELLIDEFGVEAEWVTPRATFHELEIDSLCLTELAVIVAQRTGLVARGISPQSTLAEAIGRLAGVASAPS
ncbi:phosphopantetheine-binding protein [Streptomyces ziwulingensis]